MKPILIAVSASSSQHEALCKTMITDAKKYDPSAQQPLTTAFLLPGPNSFLAATELLRIASEGRLPAAIFEIESVLLSSAGAPKA